ARVGRQHVVHAAGPRAGGHRHVAVAGRNIRRQFGASREPRQREDGKSEQTEWAGHRCSSTTVHLRMRPEPRGGGFALTLAGGGSGGGGGSPGRSSGVAATWLEVGFTR